jgi:iron complex outermembrane receptor protein
MPDRLQVERLQPARHRGSTGRSVRSPARIGLELVDFEFSALGAEAFLPDTKTASVAGFLYEELPYGPWKFSFGGRVASVKVEANEFVQAGLPAGSRTFTPWSAAVGAFYAFNKEWGLGTNVSYTQRAPTSGAHADGPHIATNAFESAPS